MTPTLHIAQDLDLTLDLGARTQAIIAQKGAGKTYTGMKETELMVAAGIQVVALDPTGVWWGLRVPGTGPGIPILVMGGEHADVPLDPNAGEIVADFVVDSAQSVILDMSSFESNAAQDRFATFFALRLYRRKSSDRAPIHLMIDEADSFIPQRAMNNQAKMLGAFEALVRRGRSRGIGLTMISQRPAVLNKNALSQADLLVAGRVVGPHDLKALREWTDMRATKSQSEQFLASLPTLKNGEAWFWSPGWLNIFQRAQVSPRKTLDSSRTPELGADRSKPSRKLVPVDLAKLTAEIKASAARVKENDPHTLHREITRLKTELENAGKPVPAKIERVEVPVLSEEDRAVIRSALFATAQNFATIQAIFDRVAAALPGDASSQRRPSNPHPPLHNRTAPNPPPPSRPQRPPVQSSSNSGLSKATAVAGGMRRMMIALAQRPGLSARQLGVRAGLSSSSGTFGTYLAKLRSNGWAEGYRDSIMLTLAGVEALGEYEPLPSGKMLFEYWQAELGGGAARMLEALYAAYPQPLNKEAIGERAGISHSSGTFGTYLAKLRTLELVTNAGAGIRAADEFFQ